MLTLYPYKNVQIEIWKQIILPNNLEANKFIKFMKFMKNYEFLKTMEYPFSTLKAYKMFGEDSWYYSHKVALSFFLVSVICFQETEMWSVFQFS